MSNISAADVRVAGEAMVPTAKGGGNRSSAASASSMSPRQPSRVWSWIKKRRRLLTGAAGIIAVLVSWEICSDLEVVDPAFCSKPSEIARAIGTYFGKDDGLSAVQTSMTEFGVGMLLSIVVGLLFGLAKGWWQWVDDLTDPLINFLYATPRIALVPLFVIWFGLGMESKVAVIFLSAVFSIIINTETGVKSTDKGLLNVAKSFRASKLQTFRTVVIPGAVPSIVTGIRLAMGHGLIGMVVAELVASTAGLGYTIEIAGNNFKTAQMFAAVFVVAGIGVVLTILLRMLERRLERWRPARDN